MYYSNTDIRTEDVPVPEIGTDEILVKTMACGICGSDLMEWYRIKKAPLVLGHELTGIVEKTGKDVRGFKVGDRVAVTHHVPCESCHYCGSGHETVCETLRTTKFYPGGFAEYLRVPAINVEKGTLHLPDEISFEEGTFIEPLGCVVRGQRAADIRSGQTVVVIGSGVSGLLHMQLAKAKGVKRVIATDVNDFRLKTATKFGADTVIKADADVPANIREHNEGRLADRVIVCTGAPSAMGQALKSVDRGGTVLFFAPTDAGVETPVKISDLWLNGLTLTTSYGAVKKDLTEALDLIREGSINVSAMITHVLGLSETGVGFRIFSEGEDCIKVVIRPHGLED